MALHSLHHNNIMLARGHGATTHARARVCVYVYMFVCGVRARAMVNRMPQRTGRQVYLFFSVLTSLLVLFDASESARVSAST